MSKVTIGHGRVATSRLSGVAGPTVKPADPRDVAEAICAIAYSDGRIGGVYVAALDVIARRLNLPQQTIDAALDTGESCGWLRRGDGQIELTAAGLYIAKVMLKLPT